MYEKVSLINSNGYELMSLMNMVDSYTDSYPANGDMLIAYQTGATYGSGTIELTVDWECEEGTPVPPAVGYSSAEYLTLPPVGTYKRLFSVEDTHKWIIPCTGMLDIEERVGNVFPGATLTFISSNTTVFTQEDGGTAEGKYAVDGYFFIELENRNNQGRDNFLFLL